MTVTIQRKFQEISESQLSGEIPDEYDFGIPIASVALDWNDLKAIPLVVLVAPAGAGKTYECRQQNDQLRQLGYSSFFINLVDLSAGELEEVFTSAEADSFEHWKKSDDIAFFFLDSVDELSLTSTRLRWVLKKIQRVLGIAVGRAHFVVTTRPVVTELECLREFAQNVGMLHKNKEQQENRPRWRLFQLMPLSLKERKALAAAYLASAEAVGQLFKAVENAGIDDELGFPLDLRYLCEYWNYSHNLGTYLKYLNASCESRLRPHENGRQDRCGLSLEKAKEGAERLALAVHTLVTNGIHSEQISNVSCGVRAVDPQKILTDWNPVEIRELLERPLFEFLAEGRVRFLHRTSSEYLAAQRIIHLVQEQGWSANSLKNLWFASIGKRRLVVPSKQELMGWLAPKIPDIFDLILQNQPELFLQTGDPAALTLSQREAVLSSLWQRYRDCVWCGWNLDTTQLRRFADPELTHCVCQLWNEWSINSELKNLLFELMIYGSMDGCQEIARQVCFGEKQIPRTRMLAVCVLAVTHDERMPQVWKTIYQNRGLWSDEMVGGLVVRLYPQYLPDGILINLLKILDNKNINNHQYFYSVAYSIKTKMDDGLDRLSVLRDLLTTEVQTKFTYRFSSVENTLPWLCELLTEISLEGEAQADEVVWRQGIFLGQLGRKKNGWDNICKKIGNLPKNVRKRMFEEANAFLEQSQDDKEPVSRFLRLEEALCLHRDDRDWLKQLTADTQQSDDLRLLALNGLMILRNSEDDLSSELRALRPTMTDGSALAKLADERRAAEETVGKRSKNEEKIVKKDKKYTFIKSIKSDPSTAFAAVNFVHTMNEWEEYCGWIHSGQLKDIRQDLGEEAFSYFEQALKEFWRSYVPKLSMDRQSSDRNIIPGEVLLGQLGLFVESQDVHWLSGVTAAEAEIIFRYLPYFDNCPSWDVALVERFSTAAQTAYERELSWELEHLAKDVGSQGVLTLVAEHDCLRSMFFARFQEWLGRKGDLCWTASGTEEDARRLQKVLAALDAEIPSDVAKQVKVAEERFELGMPFCFQVLWCSRLFRLDEDRGLSVLEKALRQTESSKDAERWFAELFGDGGFSGEVSLKTVEFKATTWRRLTELAYEYVPTSKDAPWAPGETRWRRDREFAQEGRRFCLETFMGLKGKTAYHEKLKLLSRPEWCEQKDYWLRRAETTYLEDFDRKEKEESSVIRFEKEGLFSVTDNRTMAALLEERLAEIKDWLLTDTVSPELWGHFKLERSFRCALADKLRERARGRYVVSMESVTKEEQETDIRLSATDMDLEAVLELKLGKNYSGAQLKETIEKQLVEKYLRPVNRRVGTLVIAVTDEKTWKDPETGKVLDSGELEVWLREEANRVQEGFPGKIFLSVHVWDCRPHLFISEKSDSQAPSVLTNRSKV